MKNFIVLIFICFANFNANSQAIIVKKFSGQLKESIAAGFNSINRTLVKNDKNYELWSLCIDFIKAGRRDECILVLSDGVDTFEYGVSIPNNLSAIYINLPKNVRWFGRGEEYCTSMDYVDQHIIAIGRWMWRRKPAVGGYAYDIKYAWALDTEQKIFVPVLSKNVKCEINEDLN
jgi:hypothetical protein